ncbi:MAG: efflux RND transporter periplasmic adaptor subunit [Winogradskyella sp.]|nr:efflux RND transporter periplasmic adaptor subunit [Flaviramulus sp.]MBT8323973.1 efflux RND transporter periplasmic adaptor subunit [Winogradskyella sp.]NNC50020.1 efflux RND transporter periplasmic adaptor subunit [Flaviramulus sp.]NNF86695.1 efflux RND transporter periplasmic adaptor subunit [Winogradskyella sp.]
MKNNKIVIYAGLLLVGVLLGWLLFGGSSKEETSQNKDAEAETNQMWTCSMHPQVMQPEPGDCPICGMDLIPAESGSDGLMADQFKLTENAMALANIQTTVVGKESIEGSTIKLSGKIAENEEANLVQVSYFSGRIERLNVSFTGEEVRKGQLLATIYSPELYAAQQELITAASLKVSQPALYKAVRNKLKLWKLSENQINQIEETGKVKENFPVYATVSGTVTEKLVEQGDYIEQGQPLLKIANLNTVWGNFDVYEHQIDQFKKGQEVLVTTNAYPNKEFKGKVDFIDPVLNTKTRTVTLRVVLNNRDDVFKPGMFVTATIEGSTVNNDDVITIPASAVLWTGERSVVYLKTNPDQPVFEMREIKLGNQIGNEYEVLEGVFVGNEIVTNGTFTVDAAAQLQGKKSMMNKDGGTIMTGHEDHVADNPMEKINFDASIEKSFQPVIDTYIKLKDALTKSDVLLASNMSEAFRKALEQIPVSEREKTNNYWAILHKTSKGINENVDVAHQRKQFQILSDKLIAMVRNFNKVNSKLYVQFCPMADNNNGAYWLSKDEKVINPYFGEAMLRCGEVKQVIE